MDSPPIPVESLGTQDLSSWWNFGLTSPLRSLTSPLRPSTSPPRPSTSPPRPSTPPKQLLTSPNYNLNYASILVWNVVLQRRIPKSCARAKELCPAFFSVRACTWNKEARFLKRSLSYDVIFGCVVTCDSFNDEEWGLRGPSKRGLTYLRALDPKMNAKVGSKSWVEFLRSPHL